MATAKKKVAKKCGAKCAGKPAAAKKAKPARRGRAGAAEATALIAGALAKGPKTIAELVKATGCVRVTVDKYLKAGIKRRKVKKAGLKGRAALYTGK